MERVRSFALNSTEKMEEQIEEFANSVAYKDSMIRIMPDGHAGKGCVVGSVIQFKSKIVPNTVGVDIACRVSIFDLGIYEKDLTPEFFEMFDEMVAEHVPTGFSVRDKEADVSKSFPYNKLYCWKHLKNHDHLRKSMGTLGGGNHYLELDIDKDTGRVFLTIHCGSRNLGKQVCEFYQDKAIKHRDLRIHARNVLRDEQILRLKEHKEFANIQACVQKYKDKNAKEPKDDLCYLHGADMKDYLHDMKICNEWSYWNHYVIAQEIYEGLKTICEHLNIPMSYESDYEFDKITCIHNYVDVDQGIIRKGAIDASFGEWCIIPLNMKDGVLVGVGRGNSDYLNSAPHGAGRIMSRAEAKKKITLKEFAESMNGINTSCVVPSVIDEAPAAYKNAKEIEDAIHPTVDVLYHLYPIWNFKAK